MVVIHCNDRFREHIHAEVIGSGCPDIGRCDRAIRDVVHVEFYGYRIGYVNVKSARIRAVLNGGFDGLEGSSDRPDCFCGLHWHLDMTNESRGLILVFRFDHNIRERARLGMAERVHDVVCSSEVDVSNYGGQLQKSNF